MPNYINDSTWSDAASYGAGLGRTLGQALINLPQQRQQLAFQLAQAQQEQQRWQQQQLAAEQQGREQMDMRQAMMGLQQSGQRLEQDRERRLQDEFQWRQQQPLHGTDGSWMFPPGSQQQQQPDPSLMPFVPDTNFGSTANIGLGPQPVQNRAPLPVVQEAPQPTGNQGLSAPRGWQLYQTEKKYNTQLTPNQFYNTLKGLSSKALGLQMLMQNGTTNQQFQPVYSDLTNQIAQLEQMYPQFSLKKQQPQELPVPAQTNRVFNYNPATGQLE